MHIGRNPMCEIYLLCQKNVYTSGKHCSCKTLESLPVMGLRGGNLGDSTPILSTAIVLFLFLYSHLYILKFSTAVDLVATWRERTQPNPLSAFNKLLHGADLHSKDVRIAGSSFATCFPLFQMLSHSKGLS